MILDFLGRSRTSCTHFNDNVIDINADEPHEVAEVMCVRCLYRYVAVMPEFSPLKDLECPHCKKRGALIKTGQDYEEFYED